jgi:hypothetical protein
VENQQCHARCRRQIRVQRHYRPAQAAQPPLQLMTNAKGLAAAEFDDYTFVFH